HHADQRQGGAQPLAEQRAEGEAQEILRPHPPGPPLPPPLAPSPGEGGAASTASKRSATLATSAPFTRRTMWPSTRTMMRSARRATFGSWVTTTSVSPSSLRR